MLEKKTRVAAVRLICILLAVISVISISACSKNLAGDAYDVDLKECIKVSDLSRVVISAEERDTLVMNRINLMLWQNELFTDAPDGAEIRDYDKITVDYSCIIDGLPIDGFSKKDATVYVGSGSFPEMIIRDALIGMKAGETKRYDTKFPDDFYEGMEGMAVTYEITVKKIVRPSELTDDICRRYTDYSSVEEMKREVTETVASELAFAKLYYEAEVIKYPEKEYNVYYYDVTSLERYAEEKKITLEEAIKKHGDSFSDYGMSSEMTVEEYKQFCKDYAESETKEEMLVYYILRELKVKTTGKAYSDMKRELLRQSDMADEYSYESEYGEGSLETSIRYNLMLRALEKVTVAE